MCGVEGRRGFGFVTFACAEDAQKAVKYEGGLKVRGREVAVDMCMGRREYQQDKHQKMAEEGASKKEDTADTESASLEEEEKSISDKGALDGEIEASEGRAEDEEGKHQNGVVGFS